MIPVPKARRAAYRRLAKLGAEVFMDHGAMPFDGKRMIFRGFRVLVAS